MLKLSKSFIQQYAHRIPPWDSMSYLTYKRTYARLTEEGRTEEWWETCARVCRGIVKLGGLFTQNELEHLYDLMFNLKGCVSGRALWQLDTPTVEKIGADSLVNCWCTLVNNIEAFTFAFNQLMLGGGVGFNILPENIFELPKVSYTPIIQRVDDFDCSFIVPDNREGWVELLDKVLESYFVTGQDFSYSTQCVRPAGRLISGFGGVASGPEELVTGISNIGKVIASRTHKKLRPIDCLDILNIIGAIVVSGNVRRSSEIALGHAKDTSFLNAKNWVRNPIPEWRTMSNNSAATSSLERLHSDFWEGYKRQGESYGLVNLDCHREYGRLIDGLEYRSNHDIVGVNPCGEIGLENKEPCNLAEIFLPNIKDIEEFRQVARLLYMVCKTITNQSYSDPTTDEVVKRNRKIGIGITGIAQAPKWITKKEILNEVYKHLEEVDKNYSKKLGIPESIRISCCKPSGTLSLLPGVTPGIHPAFSEYIIRRIRFSANDSLVDICRDHGYPVEPKMNLDGSLDHSVMIVSFPWQFPKGTIVQEDVSAVQQLETQKYYQTYWADNSISCTCYYKEKELPEIKKWLDGNYKDNIKSCSFLRASDHGFDQAPLEAITKEEYQKLASSVTPITRIEDTEEIDLLDSMECESGHCPVK